MRNQRRPPAPPARHVANRLVVLVTGAVCLALGVAAGYYLGRRPVPVSTTAAAPANSGAQVQGNLLNPAAFLEMETTLKSAIANNPKDLKVLIQLGNLYYDNGKFREAVDWYGRALEVDPQNVDVRTDRGTSYWNIGQPDEAIAEFSRSLEIDPTHAQTLYNLGVVYLHGKGNAAEARKAWEKLLASNPGYPDREKLRQQIAAISAGAPAAESTGGVEDLLQRMQQKQQ